MNELEKTRQEFIRQRESLMKEKEERENLALEDLQKKIETLNSDREIRKDSKEYEKLKKEYNNEYQNQLDRISSEFNGDMHELDLREEKLVLHYSSKSRELGIEDATPVASLNLAEEHAEHEIPSATDKEMDSADFQMLRMEIDEIVEKKRQELEMLEEKKNMNRTHANDVRKGKMAAIQEKYDTQREIYENRYLYDAEGNAVYSPEDEKMFNFDMKELNEKLRRDLDECQREYERVISLEDSNYQESVTAVESCYDLKVQMAENRYEYIQELKDNYETELERLRDKYSYSDNVSSDSMTSPAVPVSDVYQQENGSHSMSFEQEKEMLDQHYSETYNRYESGYNHLAQQMDYQFAGDDPSSYEKYRNYSREEQERAVNKFNSSFDTVKNDFSYSHSSSDYNNGFSNDSNIYGVGHDTYQMSSYSLGGIATNYFSDGQFCGQEFNPVSYSSQGHDDSYKADVSVGSTGTDNSYNSNSYDSGSSYESHSSEIFSDAGESHTHLDEKGKNYEKNNPLGTTVSSNSDFYSDKTDKDNQNLDTGDRYKPRLNWKEAVASEQLIQPIDSVRRGVVGQVSHESSGTVRTAVTAYRKGKEGLAIAIAVSDLGNTVNAKFTKITTSAGNVGRYVRGKELKTITKNFSAQDYMKHGLFGYARDAEGKFILDKKGNHVPIMRGNRKAIKDAKDELKDLAKLKKKRKLTSLELKRESNLKDFIKRQYTDKKKAEAKPGALNLLAGQLKKSNEIGVGGVADGISFITNRYTRRTLKMTYRASVGTMRVAGKGAAFVGRKADKLLSSSSKYSSAKNKVKKGVKGASRIKNRFISEINGGMYNRAVLYAKMKVPGLHVASLKGRVFKLKLSSLKNRIANTRTYRFASKIFNGGKAIVSAPFKLVNMIGRALHAAKALFIKAVLCVCAAYLVFVLFASMLTTVSGAVSSIIMGTAEADGKIDLSQYVADYNKIDEEHWSLINSKTEGVDEVIYSEGAYVNNFKDIISMAAVYLEQDFDDHTKVYNYMEKMYYLSHEYSASNIKKFSCASPGHNIDNSDVGGCEERTYKCTEKGHKVYNKNGCEPIVIKDEDGNVKEIKAYCPGKHKEHYCPGEHTSVNVDIYVNTIEDESIFDLTVGEGDSGEKLKKDKYIQKLLPIAVKYYKKYNILPSVIIAQSGVESAWGNSKNAQVRNNIFGIGPHMSFSSWDACVAYYCSDKLVGKTNASDYATPYQQIERIQWGKDGKADTADDYCQSETSKNYIKKVYSTIVENNLMQYDSASFLESEDNLKEWEEKQEETVKNGFEGWTEENREWAKNIYEQNWEELYVGYTEVDSYVEDNTGLSGVVFKDGNTNVVYYNQNDGWGEYGGGYSIKTSGCGPTSMAIVISTLTDNKNVNPKTVASWSYSNGYYAPGQGSYHSLIPAAANKWGLKCKEVSTYSNQEIVDALSEGKLVVCLMGPGEFTRSGHFIVLSGVSKSGKIHVADPNSRKRTYPNKEYNMGVIKASLRKWWIISK